ncbi:MAG TPA: deoxyhypusine synthase family protein [Patescibacteria group bacterium]|nr:deoxyhypusine synthase family protein [Patescibacteria group bacterium]
MKQQVRRDPKHYHDGSQEELVPLRPLDLNRITDLDEMLSGYEYMSFGARKVGEGAQTFYRMVTDPDMFVVLTLSGAMTPAKLSLVITEMVERNFVQAIVSTGALMTHGFVESSGRQHFKHDPKLSDNYLYEHGYNRIYDTIEPEQNLDDVEEIINQVLDVLPRNQKHCSRTFFEVLGKWLVDNVQGRGILKSTYANLVPVYVPALTDCEIGLDITLYNMKRRLQGFDGVAFDLFGDVEHFMELIARQNKVGIVTVGGGVPRNWAQQVMPLLELVQSRMPAGLAPPHLQPKKYTAGLRICPEPEHFGGLSGCKYSEGVSWGKFASKDNGNFTEIPADATMVLPFIVGGVMQRLRKEGVDKVRKNFSIRRQQLQIDGEAGIHLAK